VHPKIVTALLAFPEVAASASAANRHGHTALMLASKNGYAVTVKALLACPGVVASANNVNKVGKTALMIASECGHTTTIDALVALKNFHAS
jgi:ankyrin repeat protein